MSERTDPIQGTSNYREVCCDYVQVIPYYRNDTDEEGVLSKWPGPWRYCDINDTRLQLPDILNEAKSEEAVQKNLPVATIRITTTQRITFLDRLKRAFSSKKSLEHVDSFPETPNSVLTMPQSSAKRHLICSDLCSFIQRHYLRVEGLFRKASSKTLIQRAMAKKRHGSLLDEFKSNMSQTELQTKEEDSDQDSTEEDAMQEDDAHLACSIVKQHLRSWFVQEGEKSGDVGTSNQTLLASPWWLHIENGNADSEIGAKIGALLFSTVDALARNMLIRLLLLCLEIETNERRTRMNRNSLATCLAPTLVNIYYLSDQKQQSVNLKRFSAPPVLGTKVSLTSNEMVNEVLEITGKATRLFVRLVEGIEKMIDKKTDYHSLAIDQSDSILHKAFPNAYFMAITKQGNWIKYKGEVELDLLYDQVAIQFDLDSLPQSVKKENNAHSSNDEEEKNPFASSSDHEDSVAFDYGKTKTILEDGPFINVHVGNNGIKVGGLDFGHPLEESFRLKDTLSIKSDPGTITIASLEQEETEIARRGSKCSA